MFFTTSILYMHFCSVQTNKMVTVILKDFCPIYLYTLFQWYPVSTPPLLYLCCSVTKAITINQHHYTMSSLLLLLSWQTHVWCLSRLNSIYSTSLPIYSTSHVSTQSRYILAASYLGFILTEYIWPMLEVVRTKAMMISLYNAIFLQSCAVPKKRTQSYPEELITLSFYCVLCNEEHSSPCTEYRNLSMNVGGYDKKSSNKRNVLDTM